MSILSQVQLEHPFIISRLKMSDSASAQVAVDDVGGLSFPVIGSPERQLSSIVSGDTSPCSCGLGSANYWEAVLQPWVLTNGLAVEAVCVRDPYGGNLTLFAAPGQFELKALNEQLSWTVKTAANHTLTAAAQLHGWPQHVVCNYDIAAGLQSIYVDGALVASQALSGAISNALSGNVVLLKGELLGFNFVPNPSFEHDTVEAAPAAWSANLFSLNPGAVLTANGTQQKFGSHSMKVVTNTTIEAEGACVPCPGIGANFLAGQQYSASVWLKGNAGGEKCQVLLGATADDVSTVEANLTTAWQKFTVTWTPSANRSATTHGLCVRGNPAFGAIAQTWFVDGALVVKGAITEYVDGDIHGYEWEGTVGNSATVARGQASGQDIAVYGAPLSANQIKRHFLAFRQLLPDPGHVRQFSPIGVTT